MSGVIPGPVRRVLLAALLAAIGAPAPLSAQDARTLSNDALARLLDRLAGERTALTVRSLAGSAGGRPVLLAELKGRRLDATAPALLVVAGAHAPHLIGTDVALVLVDSLSAGYGRDSATTALLDRTRVLVIPRLSPDPVEAALGRPLRERVRNAASYDDDRDGVSDEDGPDDLNGDGLVTLVRVEDPTGEYAEDAKEPGLMRPADPARGEARAWRLLPEGVDDDGDGRWNEDPPGGVDVGANFPRDFPWFSAGAGESPLLAPEARGLAELLAGDDGIAVVVVLGPQDNLTSPWRLDRADRSGAAGEDSGERSGRRLRAPLHGPLPEDEPWLSEVSRRYREITGRVEADSLGAADTGGDPLSWAYYDMGRWAFGSDVWTPPEIDSGGADAAEEEEPEAEGTEDVGASGAARPEASDAKNGRPDRSETRGRTGHEESERVAADRRALRWIRAHRPQDFVDWTPVDHPDFPGRRVEVGGFAPFARWTPPAADRDSIVTREVRFVEALARMMPRISLSELRAEALGDGSWRITARVANEGFLPTATAISARMGRPAPLRVELDAGDREIAGGRRLTLLDPLPGSGAAVELTWIVVGGPGRVAVTAASPTAGRVRREVRLP